MSRSRYRAVTSSTPTGEEPAVTLANEPNPLGCIDDARRCDGFRYEVMSAAGEAEPIGACRLATQGAEALASGITGAAP